MEKSQLQTVDEFYQRVPLSPPSIYLWKALEEQLGCRAEGAFNQSTNPFNRCRAKTNWLTQRTPNGINLLQHKQTRIETQTTRTQLFVKSKQCAARVWPIYSREDQTRGVSGQLSHLQHVEILKRTVSTSDVAISILLSHFKIAKLFPIFSRDNIKRRRRRRRWRRGSDQRSNKSPLRSRHPPLFLPLSPAASSDHHHHHHC